MPIPPAPDPLDAAKGRQASGRWLRWMGLMATALLALLMLEDFRQGHNLTADDTSWQLLSWELSFAETVARVWGSATEKQRIPIFFSSLWSISVSGSMDRPEVRLLNLAVMAAAFGLFAVYAGRIFCARAGAALVLVALASSPLAYLHMPPTSYFFFPTAQTALWLTARLCLSATRPGSAAHLALRGLEAFALLSSEYVLFFAAPLMLFEALAGAPGGGLVARPRALLASPRVRGDALVLAGVVGIQVVHRLALPGEGYLELGTSDYGPLDVAVTAALHAAHGTVFPYLGADILRGADPERLARAALAVGLAALAAWPVLAAPAHPADRARDWWLLPAGLLMAASITLPVAVVEKYLRWCIGGSHCGYIESRAAGWALMLALAGLVLLALRLRGPWRLLPVAGLALTAGLTSLVNGAVAARMEADTRPWREARALACWVPDAADRQALSRLLASDDIAWHPWNDTRRREHYWRLYLARRAERPWDCAPAPVLGPETPVRVPVDGLVERVAVFGWARPEGTRLLSALRHGAMVFRIGAEAGPAARLALDLRAPKGTAAGVARIRGAPACRFRLEGAGRLLLPLPDDRAAPLLVTVAMPEAPRLDAGEALPSALRPPIRLAGLEIVPARAARADDLTCAAP